MSPEVATIILMWAHSCWLYMAFIVHVWSTVIFVRKGVRVYEPKYLVRIVVPTRKLFVVVTVIGSTLDTALELTGWNIFGNTVSILAAFAWYWITRNWRDDNFWKKQKAKILAKIEVFGAKLNVVPQGA